jgi:DNA-binding transcriptional LysR family regulator
MITTIGMKIRQLEILREVMRTGSERSATKALQVSQPAISQNLRQLEAAIGLALFHRQNNRLVPTAQRLNCCAASARALPASIASKSRSRL